MNKKDILNKTLLFVILVAFMGTFVSLFGKENSMVGVMILLLALIMLSQDLSNKPLMNFAGIAGINLAIGISAFLTYLCPQIGFFIVFIMVFFIIYTTMHSLRNPIYFPYLLGFVFLIASPVGINDLGMRLISLVLGSLFIVLLNLVINRNKFIKTSEKGIEGLIDTVKDCANKKLANEEIDSETLVSTNKTIKNGVYDTLKNNYFSTPKNRSLMNLATAIEQIGLSISRVETNEKDLKDIISILNHIKNYESESEETHKDIKPLNTKIDRFIENHPNINYAIISNFKIINYELKQIYNPDIENDADYDKNKVPMNFRLKTILKSNFNRHSAKFTFAFRIAILLAIFEFIGIYFNIPNAKWLSFTAIAIVQPYNDSVKSKSRMRIVGTVIGVIVFGILYYTCLGTPNLIGINGAIATSIVTVLIGYIYTLLDFESYDIEVIFLTLQSLLTAIVAIPGTGSIIERFAFVIGSTIICTVANFVIFPYTLKKENTQMINSYKDINTEELKDLKEAVETNDDEVKTANLVLKANLLEDKIRANNLQDNDEAIDEIIKLQTEITSQATFLRNSLDADSLPEKTKEIAISSIDKYGLNNENNTKVPEDTSEIDNIKDIDNKSKTFLNTTLSLLKLYNQSERLIAKL